jgi:hypothetical protein
MNEVGRMPTLYQPAIYEIQVPGEIGESGSGWAEGLTVTVPSPAGEEPVTTLRGHFDQASLQGLLRRLYSLGLPLISVRWVGDAPPAGGTDKR